ncbi:MAG: hypothetical protein ABUR63_09410, partial [Verrucomicrobiota bacterium]
MSARSSARAQIVALAGVCFVASPARGQAPGAVTPPVAEAAPPPALEPAAPVAPVEVAPAGTAAATMAPPPAAPPPKGAGPVPTGDAGPLPSDHDAVIGRVGVSARRLDTGPVPLALRSGLGCAADRGVACTVTVGALGARYWTSGNLAFNGALALAAGGGSSGSASLDTYLGVGPVVGISLLL